MPPEKLKRARTLIEVQSKPNAAEVVEVEALFHIPYVAIALCGPDFRDLILELIVDLEWEHLSHEGFKLGWCKIREGAETGPAEHKLLAGTPLGTWQEGDGESGSHYVFDGFIHSTLILLCSATTYLGT